MPEEPRDRGGVRRRLILGVGAISLGPLSTIVLQLASLPVFLHFWGAEKYGEWLMLSAIPTYLSMSDMGFGTVAGNDMTMRIARGDFAGAICTFQSTWKLITLISLALLVLLLPVVASAPIAGLLHLKAIPAHDAKLALLVLVVDSLACLQTSLPMSSFRSAGLNHVAHIGSTTIRIVEGICVLIAVWRGFGPVALALILLSVRAMGNFTLAIVSRRLIPWLRFGFEEADSRRVRELFLPALAFMAFPASNAFSLQGMMLAIGLVMGPFYVSVFAPLRTLSRAAVQATEIFKLGFWPEVSSAYGAQDYALARKLHRAACQFSILMSSFVVLLLAVFGHWILRVWTHGKIPINLPTFYLLLLSVTATSLWNASSIVPISANLHKRIAIEQLASTLVALVGAIALMHIVGLSGCAFALLLAEIFMVLMVVPASVNLLHDHLTPFLRSLFDIPSLLTTLRRKLVPVRA